MTQLLDELRQAAAPAAPKGFAPGVIYAGARPDTITLPPQATPLETEEEWLEAVKSLGVPLPAGHTLELVEARYNQAAWLRDPADRGAKDSAYTGGAWWYRFKVVPASLRADEDLTRLFKEAKKAAKKRTSTPKVTGETMVIALADFQVGKTDDRGGTAELLERVLTAKGEIVARARRLKPAQIVLADPGDALEMFESAPNADRTNDLQFTEQIRVWRRLLWGFIVDLAPHTDDLLVVGVPSNHCRIRRGKNAVGPQNDDLGLEVIAQVSDMADVAGLDNVRFMVPHGLDEHLAVTLAGGKVFGLFHGHQKSNPKMLTQWVKDQGRRPIGQADIVVAGHFHHLDITTFGDDQWLFVAPTMDAGSAWYRNISGNDSRPGILTFMVDTEGWRDMHVAWTK